MKKRLLLIAAALTLALLCAACATNAATPEPETDAEELAAESVDADSREGDTMMSDGLTLRIFHEIKYTFLPWKPNKASRLISECYLISCLKIQFSRE